MNRLKNLEKRISRLAPAPWVVEVWTPEGRKEMTVHEMMEYDFPNGLGFHTVRGGGIRELDLFLDWIGGVV